MLQIGYATTEFEDNYKAFKNLFQLLHLDCRLRYM